MNSEMNNRFSYPEQRDKLSVVSADTGKEKLVNLSAMLNIPGEIRLFAGQNIPDGWMPCEGQLLSVSDYPLLFSVLGNVYGGDGVSNFALPNARRGAGAERRIIFIDFSYRSTIQRVTVPAAIHGPIAGNYPSGAVLSFFVQLLDDIAVTGGPISLNVDIGGAVHTLAFVSGNARSWEFADYVVQPEDVGDVTAAINFNGATLSTGGIPVALSMGSVVSNVAVNSEV